MNFDPTEEQQMFIDTVERFATPIDVEARRRLRSMPGGYDRTRWRQLADLGLIGLAVAEQFGGLGGTYVDLALVGEAFGKSNAADPWLENGVIPTRILAAAGAADALANAISGEQIFTLAWAERAQRYNIDPQHCQVDGQYLTGEKSFALGSAIADSFIITARDKDEFAIFCLPRQTKGLDIRHYRLADGSIAGELRLNRVALDGAKRLNLSRSGFATTVAEARLIAAAELVGLGQRLLDDTITYVKEREQFGVAIGSFQALQHRLVDCYARVEQARSMLYRAALGDQGDLQAWGRATAGAKAYISNAIDHVAREAVQMHGGMGITDELAIGHAMKRVLLLSRLFGDIDSNLAQYAEAA